MSYHVPMLRVMLWPQHYSWLSDMLYHIPTGWVSAVHGNPYMEPEKPEEPPKALNSHTINNSTNPTYRRFQLQLAVSSHMEEVNFWRLEGLPPWTMEWIIDYSLTILKTFTHIRYIVTVEGTNKTYLTYLTLPSI